MSLSGPPQKENKNSRKLEVLLIVFITIGSFFLAAYFELAERWQQWALPEENYQLDELIFSFLTLSLCLSWFSHRHHKRLQATLKQNMAISATLKNKNTEVVTLLAQNRELIKHITQVREAERKELATELHDVFGQYLAAIEVNAAVAYKYTEGDDKIQPILEIIQTSASYLIEVTRSQLQSIKPPSLASVGLSASIESLASQWLVSFQTYQLTISIQVNDERVNSEVALTIYRCLQEGLSNIVKHAHANNICINLSTHSDDGIHNEIILILRDDGIGFIPDNDLSKGLGLIGMRERVTALSGQLSITKAAPQGSVVTINIPL